jgi:two-component system, NarL family, nitrate/nitrite response regulator NarL
VKRLRPLGVLIASENRLFRECLADRITREKKFRVDGLTDASDLGAVVKKLRPDILLFDADALGPMPEELLLRLRQNGAMPRILFLAEDADDRAVTRALRFGAGGLVGKAESVATMFRAMEAVVSGETWAGRKAIARALEALADSKRKSSASLTPRERQLLSLLPAGYRNKELASLIKVKEQTIKIHLHNLFRKLNVGTRVEAVLKAAEHQ